MKNGRHFKFWNFFRWLTGFIKRTISKEYVCQFWCLYPEMKYSYDILLLSAPLVGTYKDKEEELLNLMKERRLDILGMSETRLKNKESGLDLGDNYTLIYSGIEQGTTKYGVAILVGPRLSRSIKAVKLVNERIMKISLQLKRGRMHIFQVYAPEQGLTNQIKEQFYEELESEIELLPDNENIIIMGDLNGRVGLDRTNLGNVIGPFGEATRNDDGERLIDWCLLNNMSIMNGFFKQRDSHKFTRYR